MYSACTQTERKFVIIYFYDVIRNKFVVGGTLAEREAISRNVIRNTSFSALPGVKEKQNSEEARGEDVYSKRTDRIASFRLSLAGGRLVAFVVFLCENIDDTEIPHRVYFRPLRQ